MTVGKGIGLCALIGFLGGCTPLSVEEPNSIAETELAVEDSDSVADAAPVDEESALTVSSEPVTDSVVEIAPKDRFIITNTGSCALEALMIELDLSQSAGRLIFDTTATGAGVEVFQPFEVETGDIVQLATDAVADGDAELALQVAYLGPGEAASFTIDVDDTLPSGELGQIRVADSEIQGGIVSIAVGNAAATQTRFDAESTAQATLPVCSSAP